MSKVAFLGLGRMGLPMASNLVRAGHDVSVWNRTEAKSKRFADRHSTKHAGTPSAAVDNADFVITMLAGDDALLEVYQAPNGILRSVRPGTILLDMGTTSPSVLRRLSEQVSGVGCVLIDAPVSGSVAAAASGTLTIMAGGDNEAVASSRRILACLGSHVVQLGPSGTGCAMKLAVNSVLHGLNCAVSEALVLAEKCGIERKAAYAVFMNSAISAPFVRYRQEAFENPQVMSAAFRMELAINDVRSALQLGIEVGAPLPQSSRNLETFESAVAAGLGGHDESAVAQYLRAMDSDGNPSPSGARPL